MLCFTPASRLPILPLRWTLLDKMRVPQRNTMRGVQRGFTLIEMMVVIAIAGIVAALATLQLTGNPRRELFEQSRHLAAQFEAAGDQAALRSKLVAWRPTPSGYGFEIRDASRRWVPLHDAVLGDARWQVSVTGVEIREFGRADPIPRVVFGIEPLGLPVRVILHSTLGNILISGAGDGRFHAEQLP